MLMGGELLYDLVQTVFRTMGGFSMFTVLRFSGIGNGHDGFVQIYPVV